MTAGIGLCTFADRCTGLGRAMLAMQKFTKLQLTVGMWGMPAGALAGLVGQPAVLAYAGIRVVDERVEAGYAEILRSGSS